MSSKYKIRDQDKFYFVTFSVVNWIDVFTRQTYRDIFIESVRYCQSNKGLKLAAYCVMSNHIHMIIGRKGTESIESIIRDVKKFTSVKIINAIELNQNESRQDWMLCMFERAGKKNSNNIKYQFWQQGNHSIELFTLDVFGQKLNYIQQNPVRAGIVLRAEEYLYSSAGSYAGQKNGLLDVYLAV